MEIASHQCQELIQPYKIHNNTGALQSLTQAVMHNLMCFFSSSIWKLEVYLDMNNSQFIDAVKNNY